MKNQRDFLNKKYLNLCQQLGDSQIKLDQLNKIIQNIKDQIKELDNAFLIMSEYETIKVKERQSDQK